jgi:site-specific DNA-methyltransferase (adenine-specific)
MTRVDLRHGDCLDVLRSLPDCSMDAVVTDPPYGLAEHKPERIAQAVTAWTSGDREHVPDGKGFMGRAWDGFVPPPAVWDECLRVLKPGGHLLAFAGSRTADLMGLSVRLAGFEIRDTIMWVYGSGMPKGQNVGKAIDATLLHGGANSRRIKAANASRPGEGRIAPQITNNGHMGEKVPGSVTRDQPATPEAARWEGWNTALKPAQEPIIVARKPLTGTVAANTLAHGTGGINVDATRVAHDEPAGKPTTRKSGKFAGTAYASDAYSAAMGDSNAHASPSGRWPANVVLVHADTCEDGGACTEGVCPVAELDRQAPNVGNNGQREFRPGAKFPGAYGDFEDRGRPGLPKDKGGASRFFETFRYQAKAPASERPKIYVPPASVLRLRDDLTDEQRAYVLGELTRRGIDVA